MSEENQKKWKQIEHLYPEKKIIEGKVIRHEGFGIFLDIGEAPIIGLINITNFSYVGRMTSELFPPIGTKLKCLIVSTSDASDNGQIRLSLKSDQLINRKAHSFLPEVKLLIKPTKINPQISALINSQIEGNVALAIQLAKGLNILPQTILLHWKPLLDLVNIDIGPPEETLLELLNLKYLNLWGQNISSLPDNINFLRNLEIIQLRDNNITELPPTFSSLSMLSTLHLVSNRLSTFPEEFLGLKKLIQLNLRDNQISKIPVGIDALTNLYSLDLSYNKIKTLPLTLNNLQQLRELNLRNNPLSLVSNSVEKLINLRRLHLSKNMSHEKSILSQKLPHCEIFFY